MMTYGEEPATNSALSSSTEYLEGCNADKSQPAFDADWLRDAIPAGNITNESVLLGLAKHPDLRWKEDIVAERRSGAIVKAVRAAGKTELLSQFQEAVIARLFDPSDKAMLPYLGDLMGCIYEYASENDMLNKQPMEGASQDDDPRDGLPSGDDPTYGLPKGLEGDGQLEQEQDFRVNKNRVISETRLDRVVGMFNARSDTGQLRALDLRPHQKSTVSGIREYLGSDRNILRIEVAAPNFGKTVVAIQTILDMGVGERLPGGENVKAVYVVPNHITLEQVTGMDGATGFGKFAPDLKIAECSGRKKDLDGDVIVTTSDFLLSLTKKPDKLAEFRDIADIWILDELTEIVGKLRGATLAKLVAGKKAVGFAVHDRFADNKTIFDYFQYETSQPRTVKEASQEGWFNGIKNYRFGSSAQFDVEPGTSELTDKEYAIFLQTPEQIKQLNEDIVRVISYLASSTGGPGLICCMPGNKSEHARNVAELASQAPARDSNGNLLGRNWVVKAIGSFQKSDDNLAILKELRLGEVDAVTYTRLANFGVDMPLKYFIDSVATNSSLQKIQRVGRAGRLHDSLSVYVEMVYGMNGYRGRQVMVSDLFEHDFEQGIQIGGHANTSHEVAAGYSSTANDVSPGHTFGNRRSSETQSFDELFRANLERALVLISTSTYGGVIASKIPEGAVLLDDFIGNHPYLSSITPKHARQSLVKSLKDSGFQAYRTEEGDLYARASEVTQLEDQLPGVYSAVEYVARLAVSEALGVRNPDAIKRLVSEYNAINPDSKIVIRRGVFDTGRKKRGPELLFLAEDLPRLESYYKSTRQPYNPETDCTPSELLKILQKSIDTSKLSKDPNKLAEWLRKQDDLAQYVYYRAMGRAGRTTCVARAYRDTVLSAIITKRELEDLNLQPLSDALDTLDSRAIEKFGPTQRRYIAIRSSFGPQNSEFLNRENIYKTFQNNKWTDDPRLAAYASRTFRECMTQALTIAHVKIADDGVRPIVSYNIDVVIRAVQETQRRIAERSRTQSETV